MKFIADENIETAIIENLRINDHEVIAIRESCPGCDDDGVFKLAQKENGILITSDKEFGEFTFYQQKSIAGIILLRTRTELVTTKISLINHLLRFHGNKLHGHFTIVSDSQIKIRPFWHD